MYDFSHNPKSPGQGVVQSRQKRLRIKPLLTILAIVAVLIWLLPKLWTKEQQPITIQKPLGVQQNAIERQQTVHNSIPKEALLPNSGNTSRKSKTLVSLDDSLPEVPEIEEDFAFYDILNQPPPEREITPEKWDKGRIYSIKTSLLNTRTQALQLRAQLFFQGYSNIEIQQKTFNQQPVYVVKVNGVLSRSTVNKIIDFFADMGIESNYNYRTKQ